jgi:hypothetical protein
METMEFPAVEELEDETPPDFIGTDIDLAAFKLWREASRPDMVADAALDRESE